MCESTYTFDDGSVARCEETDFFHNHHIATVWYQTPKSQALAVGTLYKWADGDTGATVVPTKTLQINEPETVVLRMALAVYKLADPSKASEADRIRAAVAQQLIQKLGV